MANEIRGLKETLSSLKILPEKIRRNVLTGAVRAGTKPIVKAARNNAPEKSGTLKKSIGVVKRKTKSKTFVRFSVMPRQNVKFNVFYARMVEYGTSNMAGIAYMRPAYENQSDESIKEVREYIKKRLPKEIAKAKK